MITTGVANYVYDEAGHLVGEYDAAGKAVYETVYLGDMPVAALTQPAIGQTTVSYVYADHLNTARVIVRPADQAIVWSWGGNEPFGQTQANSNPNGLGTFTYNPRFPGQVADAESGWFYNWHRDYNPAMGRYVQSDPIGLAAGNMSTYGYVGGGPLRLIDPQGLQALPSLIIIPGTTINANVATSLGNYAGGAQGIDGLHSIAPNAASLPDDMLANNTLQMIMMWPNVGSAVLGGEGLGLALPTVAATSNSVCKALWNSANSLQKLKTWKSGIGDIMKMVSHMHGDLPPVEPDVAGDLQTIYKIFLNDAKSSLESAINAQPSGPVVIIPKP